MAKQKVEGTKVITVDSLEQGIQELINDGMVAANINELIAAEQIKAEIDTVEVEAGKFLGEYVRFSIGDKATSAKAIIAALTAIGGGNLNAPVKEDGEDGELDWRKPSLVKFALYGADLNARSRTSQRVKSAAEGPEKAIEKMAANIMKAKPGKYTQEQAVQMARMVLGEDDDTAAE